MAAGDETLTSGRGRGRAFFGLTLIVLGLLLFLEALGLIGHGVMHWFWTLILIGLGLAKLARPGRRPAGLWLLVIGVLLLLQMIRVAPLRKTWPLLVVTAGAALLLKNLDRPFRPAGVGE